MEVLKKVLTEHIQVPIVWDGLFLIVNAALSENLTSDNGA